MAKLWLHDDSECAQRLVQFLEQKRFSVTLLSCYKDEKIHQIRFTDIFYMESLS